MRRVAIVLGLCLTASPALASHHHYRHYAAHHHRHYSANSPIGGLPWCGWYMAQKLGIGGSLGRQLWVARNWASMGRATTPHVGAIVVWPHHVGQIVGQQNGVWLVNSGNDGGAIRTRPRSLAGAIAFRDVGAGAGDVYYAPRRYAHRVKGEQYAALEPQYQMVERPDYH